MLKGAYQACSDFCLHQRDQSVSTCVKLGVIVVWYTAHRVSWNTDSDQVLSTHYSGCILFTQSFEWIPLSPCPSMPPSMGAFSMLIHAFCRVVVPFVCCSEFRGPSMSNQPPVRPFYDRSDDPFFRSFSSRHNSRALRRRRHFVALVAQHVHVRCIQPGDQMRNRMKYIFVTGGVVSGLGKGITASSIGVLLRSAGLRVTAIKIGACRPRS